MEQLKVLPDLKSLWKCTGQLEKFKPSVCISRQWSSLNEDEQKVDWFLTLAISEKLDLKKNTFQLMQAEASYETVLLTFEEYCCPH